MHEMGIVYHVADEVEKIAAQNDICHIGSVTLQIGEVTGVIFDYMSDLWGWVSDKSSLLKGSRLLYEQIPAVTLCKSWQCPHCGSWDTVLVQGNEYIIKQIEADS